MFGWSMKDVSALRTLQRLHLTDTLVLESCSWNGDD